MMKEIGGYIELDTYHGQEYYADGLAVVSGRAAAVLLMQMRGYQKVYIPDFMCSSLRNMMERFQIAYDVYTVDNSLMPCLDTPLQENEAVYLVNYYGQLRAQLDGLKERWKHIIVDNTQDFFFRCPEIDAVCTCRKYFGVPDGGYIILGSPCDTSQYDALPLDFSGERMGHLLGRFEHSASEYYAASVANNKLLADLPLLKMSKLTHNLLRALDYQQIAARRTQNFTALHDALSAINLFDALTVPEGAFMYPLMVEEGAELRTYLQKQKVFVPKLWPDVWDTPSANWLAEHIVPLPCDQRYTTDDMENICKMIHGFYHT